MISGIIQVEASVISRGRRPRLITFAETLFTGYHKNRIQLLFYYTLFYGKIYKNYCVKCNTRANSRSGRITRNHSIAQITRNHSGAYLARKLCWYRKILASFIMSKLCTALKCQLSENLNVFRAIFFFSVHIK